MVARIKPPPVSDKETSDTKLNLFVLYLFYFYYLFSHLFTFLFNLLIMF